MHGTFIINEGNIENINLSKGGTCKINKGVIGEIELSDDSGNINLTIGDINSQVNNTTPEIGNIRTRYGTITVECIINFYNGIIKKCEFDFNGEESIDIIEYDIRSGYKVQKNSNGITLVKE